MTGGIKTFKPRKKLPKKIPINKPWIKGGFTPLDKPKRRLEKKPVASRNKVATKRIYSKELENEINESRKIRYENRKMCSCKKCDYIWKSRRQALPAVCPRCGSNTWREREYKILSVIEKFLLSLPIKWQLWLVINPLVTTLFYIIAFGLDFFVFFILYSLFWLIVIPLLIVFWYDNLEVRSSKLVHTENAIVQSKEENLYDRVSNEIENFVPFKKYKTEEPYQIDLARYLEKKFKNIKIELTRSSARPDIIVENDLAIEVKGPTYDHDLQTIADKCLRYPQYFKKGLIIVLFDIHVSDKRYDDWFFGMKKHFPSIRVVKNENAK